MRDDSLQAQIEQYKQRIAQQEDAIALLERRCEALHDELGDFEARYNRIVKPIADRLDAVKTLVESLREARLKNRTLDDFLRQAAGRVDHVADAPPNVDPAREEAADDINKDASKSERIKALYHKLARRYHPDLATDDADRQRRTRLMSLINQAYTDNDLETLQALYEETVESIADAKGDSTEEFQFDTSQPLARLTLRRLRARSQELAERLRDLQTEFRNLKHGALMELKQEDARARDAGDDMLTELADDMQREYWEYMEELNALRSELKS